MSHIRYSISCPFPGNDAVLARLQALVAHTDTDSDGTISRQELTNTILLVISCPEEYDKKEAKSEPEYLVAEEGRKGQTLPPNTSF